MQISFRLKLISLLVFLFFCTAFTPTYADTVTCTPGNSCSASPETVSVSAIVGTPPDDGGDGGGGPCVLNPALCIPPPDTCATNPALCVPPPDICIDHPELCIPPPETCATNPILCLPVCTQNPTLCVPPPNPCTINPSRCLPPPLTCAIDPSVCVPPPTFCQIYPTLCVPKDPPPLPLKIPEGLKQFATDLGGTTTAVVGIVSVGIASIVGALLSNPFSLYDIFLILARLWSLILVFFGIRKKANPWGTVYDSVTKQPIDPAYVVLFDAQGNEVATSITDIEGRYGFSVPAGTYTIIANKTNYEFPSKKLAGKIEDELYRDLYFGGPITVTEEGGVIAKNIPLDQLNFDWNEYAKQSQKRLKHFKRRDVIVTRISNIFFIAGFIVTGIAVSVTPNVLNIVLIAIYIITGLIRISGFRLKPKGSVVEHATGQALPFSVLRVFSTTTDREMLHKVTDALGGYYMLLPNGTYRVVVDQKNADESYTSKEIPRNVSVTNGYMRDDFRV